MKRRKILIRLRVAVFGKPRLWWENPARKHGDVHQKSWRDVAMTLSWRKCVEVALRRAAEGEPRRWRDVAQNEGRPSALPRGRRTSLERAKRVEAGILGTAGYARGASIFLFAVFLAAVTALIVIAPSKYVVPVIMYHNIDYKKGSALSVTPESFERQMRFLRRSGYNVIGIDELAGLLKDKKPLKPKTIAITFDDGFENNYLSAYPVLKKYKLPAAIFVIVSEIGKEGYSTWNELREMSENNITIGSHTLTHAYLTSLDPETLDKELALSKSILEEKLNKKVNVMSYPLGGFNERVKEAVKRAGYAGACATSPGKKYPNNDRYMIKRLRISRQCDNLFVFWIETSGFYTWIKEHRDDD